MSLEELVHRVEAKVYALGKRFLPGDPVSRWHDEAEQLSARLQELYSRASRCRAAVHVTRGRIDRNEIREAMLASGIEAAIHNRDQASAYDQAMELDAVRRQLIEDRDRLQREERAYRISRDRIVDLEPRLAELQEKLYSHGRC